MSQGGLFRKALSNKNYGEYCRMDQLFDVTRYPTGETRSTLKAAPDELQSICTVEAAVHSWEGIMQAITQMEVMGRHMVKPNLFMPYMPFARDDRRRSSGDSDDLTCALELLADAAEGKFIIADPHSDVSATTWHIPQWVCVEYALSKMQIEHPVFVIPDDGATKKAHTWLDGRPMTQGKKHRDPQTGKLSGFGLDDPSGLITGRNVVVYDDICDGGGTFFGLLDQILERNPRTVHLAVTHGLFTKGRGGLEEQFDSVFACSDNYEALWDYNERKGELV